MGVDKMYDFLHPNIMPLWYNWECLYSSIIAIFTTFEKEVVVFLYKLISK